MKVHIVRAPATDRYRLEVAESLDDLGYVAPTLDSLGYVAPTLESLGYVPPTIPVLPPVVGTVAHDLSGQTFGSDADDLVLKVSATEDANYNSDGSPGVWASDAWTCPVGGAGLYQLVVKFVVDSGAAFADRTIRVRVLLNTATNEDIWLVQRTGPSHQYLVVTTIQLDATDSVSVELLSAGASLDIDAGRIELFYMAP